ncbi:SemD/SinC family type III secretion system effector [Chlamydia avium]|uniref:Uncharacterized protein n=1 Tax=Chlamydia avium 10DC88 TaxID=1229831 RepID=W8JSB0_9CHLA|nr:hypothetical protein [Chlamydia avium]AHK63713.1 Uncharacterized protein M832_08640 [Chlamydia avium 10DC88]
MGINPSNRGQGSNDLWISGTPDTERGVEGSQSPSGELGTHRVSTASNSSRSSGILARISASVRSFFSSIFGRGSSSSSSSRPSTASESSLTSRLSVESTGDARATEGAASGLQKRGYIPGKPVPTPKVETSSLTRSGAIKKRRAPLPPTGNKESKVQRRDSDASETSANSTDSAISTNSSIVKNLKSYLEANARSKQEQVSKLAEQIKNRWTTLENSDELNYKITSLQTLVDQMGSSRRDLTKELQLTRSGIHDNVVDQTQLLSQTLWKLASKHHDQGEPSGLFSLLVHMSFGGPTLAPSAKVHDYMRDLLSLHGDDELEEQERKLLDSFADNIDRLRDRSPNDALRAWANFISRGEVAVRGVVNRELATNVGGYVREEVGDNVQWNLSALSLLQQLDPGVFATTMGVLATEAL